MDILSISPEEFVSDEEVHLKRLLDREIWDKIPLINCNELHHFKNGTLVRFRGMVQDMYGQEFYLESMDVYNEKTNTKTVRIGKYCDAVVSAEGEQLVESSCNRPDERHNFVSMSIPGLNAWVEQYECEKYKIPTKTEDSQPCSKKRSYDEVMETESNTSELTALVSPSKRVINESETKAEEEKRPVVSREHIINSPLGDNKSKVCHIKLYKDFDSLKLNDTCEFVGFISVDPIADAFYNTDGEFKDQMEVQTHHPPGSLVPRVHVVHFKSILHSNPLLEYPLDENVVRFDCIKKELLLVLTQLLLGDSLAAEYLICHLISEIYLRRDFMPLGKFALNISNVPNLQDIDYVKEVYGFLEMMMTKSHYLPLTLENMNTLAFTPKKDYECNRLTSGILQLSKNTLLVLDETKLKEGKLENSGVQGVKSLANAIKTQKVPYDFNYYPIEFECNIQFLIFSEGKSMLPSDIHIPLKPDESCLNTYNEIVNAAKHFLKPELLNEIRKYLTQARLIKYEISDGVQDLVQQEFVNMRQKSNITGEDLHGLLVLARLLCLSEGKSTLDAECWRRACEMEQQRKVRIR